MKKTKAKTRNEHALEERVKKWAKEQDGRCEKLVLYNQRGWPDRTIWLPGGIVFFVELKDGDNEPDFHQRLWIKRLTKRGIVAGAAWSLEDVQELARRAGWQG